MKHNIKSIYRTPQHQKFIDQLAPDILSLKGIDPNRFARIRRKVNDLIFDLPNSKKSFAQDFLFQIKRMQDRNVNLSFNKNNSHCVTDHAFCRGLEHLFGVDMNEAKNRMYKFIIEGNKDYVRKDGMIITVLPDDKID